MTLHYCAIANCHRRHKGPRDFSQNQKGGEIAFSLRTFLVCRRAFIRIVEARDARRRSASRSSEHARRSRIDALFNAERLAQHRIGPKERCYGEEVLPESRPIAKNLYK